MAPPALRKSSLRVRKFGCRKHDAEFLPVSFAATAPAPLDGNVARGAQTHQPFYRRRDARRRIEGAARNCKAQGIANRSRSSGRERDVARRGQRIGGAYLGALDQIAARGLPATVSLKATQFGMDVSETACYENVLRVAARAQEIGSRVEIDMEVDRLYRSHPRAGVRRRARSGRHPRLPSRPICTAPPPISTA